MSPRWLGDTASEEEIARYNEAQRARLKRLYEGNATHRLQRCATEDAIECPDCGIKISGYEVAASDGHFRVRACTARLA